MNFVSKGGIASTYLYVYTVRRFDFLVNQFTHSLARMRCDAMRQRASTLTRDSDARAEDGTAFWRRGDRAFFLYL